MGTLLPSAYTLYCHLGHFYLLLPAPCRVALGFLATTSGHLWTGLLACLVALVILVPQHRLRHSLRVRTARARLFQTEHHG